MDLILSNTHNNKLENAEPDLKAYIELLERKLKSFELWENFNNQCEQKCLDLQEELYSLKSQKNADQSELNEEHKKLMKELQEKNIILEGENKKLKLQITALQFENEKLKNNNFNINRKISPNDSSKIIQHSQLSNTVSDNNSYANCILIKGFTELQLQANPKKNIITLGRYMNIKLSDNDIVFVSNKEREFYNRNNIQPKQILLIVQFRNAEIKVEFLKNKEKLKQYFNVADVEISDYVTDDVYNLYQYAKILKSHGYNIIYWRNNCVYVKKTQSKLCEPILIKSIKDVDDLKSAKKK